MKLSNLLAQCLLGLVDFSSSFVLPKAMHLIPEQMFRLWSECLAHLKLNLEIISLDLCLTSSHCVVVQPKLLLLHGTVIHSTRFHLLLDHRGCFFVRGKIYSMSPQQSLALAA